MGGQITIGIRHPQRGTTFAHRWTNDFPWRFMQPSFLDGGEEALKYIDEAKPEHEWPLPKRLPRLQNSEYGIVLIDFITREVYSRQGYNTPGVLYYTANLSTADSQAYSAIVELIRRGQIAVIKEWDFTGDDEGPKPSTPAAFLKKARTERSSWTIQLAPDVFKIDATGDKPTTITEAKAWMKKRGWNENRTR